MSIEVMTMVWKSDSTNLKGSARLLMLAIADNANEKGYAYPGIEHLSKKTGVSDRQVMRLIQQLEEGGWLKVKRSPNKVNKYFIQLDKLKESVGDISSPSLSGDNLSYTSSHDNTSPESSDNLSRDTSVTQQVTPMSPEPSINRHYKKESYIYDAHEENQAIRDVASKIASVVVEPYDFGVNEDRFEPVAQMVMNLNAVDRIDGFSIWWKVNGHYNTTPYLKSFKNHFKSYLNGDQLNVNGKDEPAQKHISGGW